MPIRLMVVLAASMILAGVSYAQDKEKAFDPAELVGAWKLVSGEARGKPMAKDSTGGNFVFTKDTLTGMSRFGEVKSGMTYTLDSTKNPVAMMLTVTKNFPGARADAIVDIRDGRLYLCYGGIGKEPTSFTTKEGDNNRSMVFVKSVDPAEIKKAVEANRPSPRINACGTIGVRRLKLRIDCSFAWVSSLG